MMAAETVDEGWSWVVMMSSFLSQMLTGGLVYSSGVFNVMFLDAFQGELVAVIAWIPSIMSGLTGAVGPLAAIVCNKYGCRTSAFLSGLLMSGGLFISSFATSPAYLVASYGVLTGIGSGFAYTPVVGVLGYWFDQKYGFATALSSIGYTLGSLWIPPLVEFLKHYYSWRGCLCVLAGILMHLCAISMLMRPHQREKVSHKKSPLSFKGIFRKPTFITQAMYIFMSDLAIGSVYAHLCAYAVRLGTSTVKASLLITVSSTFGVITKLLIGAALTDKDVDVFHLYIGSYAIIGFATLLFPLYSYTYLGQIGYAALFGAYGTIGYALHPIVTRQCVGFQQLPSAFGILMVFSGIAHLVGPPLTGMFVDVTLSYVPVFACAGSLYLVSGAITMLTFLLIARHKQADNIQTEIQGYDVTATAEIIDVMDTKV